MELPWGARAAGLARATARAVLLAAWTGGSFVLWVAGVPAAAAVGRRTGWRRGVMALWGRGQVRVLGGRLRVTGTPPSGSFLLVSNHVSYVDIPVLTGCTGTVFVSKAEVARWPGIGFLARAVGTVFLERERKRDLPRALGHLREHLADGAGVTFFPEGTSTNGLEVAPFRPSLLAVAAEAGLPVRVAALRYRTRPPSPPASESVAWWGDAAFAPHVWSLLQLPGFEAEVAFDPVPCSDPDRKRLAELLQGRASALLPRA